MSGLTLHAAERCDADDRQALEQLCRCITRPALANEQVHRSAAGRVVTKLKTPWRDCITRLVMSPLAFRLLRIELSLCGRRIHPIFLS